MGLVRVRLSVVLESQGNGLFTRAVFGLFVAQHHDWRRRPTTADGNPTPETTSRSLSAEVEPVPMVSKK